MRMGNYHFKNKIKKKHPKGTNLLNRNISIALEWVGCQEGELIK